VEFLQTQPFTPGLAVAYAVSEAAQFFEVMLVSTLSSRGCPEGASAQLFRASESPPSPFPDGQRTPLPEGALRAPAVLLVPCLVP
jgi:hypothetical protein